MNCAGTAVRRRIELGKDLIVRGRRIAVDVPGRRRFHQSIRSRIQPRTAVDSNVAVTEQVLTVVIGDYGSQWRSSGSRSLVQRNHRARSNVRILLSQYARVLSVNERRPFQKAPAERSCRLSSGWISRCRLRRELASYGRYVLCSLFPWTVFGVRNS